MALASPRSVIGVAAVALTAGCVSSDEVERVRSPSGRLEAVVVERNGGATTSFGYRVYVVPRGRGTWAGEWVADFYAAVRDEDAYGVTPRWAGPRALAVEYLRAQHAELRARDVTVAGERVRVSLRDGVADPAAPPGGMLYNLRGRPHDRPAP